MDTIQVSIKINENKMIGITHGDLLGAAVFISGIKSSYGYTFCRCLEISKNQNLIIKVSFPRFYKGINAFLISNDTQCMQVQHEFCLAINSHLLLCDAEIILDRVDIPFTVHMGEKRDFNSYKKVYQIFDYIYRKKNEKSMPKAFSDIENYRIETLTYSDSPTISAANKKIMIYDQYNNIKSKTGEIGTFTEIEEVYTDLEKRMRIEVSKRIRRKGFTIQEFSQFNIFKEYSFQYKNYILENILDLNEIDNFYNEKAQKLATKLLEYREEPGYFTYENFIYREIHNIYDYEVIRRALKICIDNQKTRERAITTIRKVLNTYQLRENVIVMDTYLTIVQIRNTIEWYFVR